MSSSSYTTLMYGIPLTNKDVKTMEEKLGRDLFENPDIGDCEVCVHGNMVSGDTFTFLGIADSVQSGPDAHKEARKVSFDTSNGEWDKKLFIVCLETDLVSLESGWTKKPDWYLLTYYG